MAAPETHGDAIARDRIARLVAESSGGDEAAFDRLVALVYEDLRGIARRQLRRQAPDATLNTTALVHELYVNLAGSTLAGWNDRGHFFAVASRAMRHILIDYIRRRNAAKRSPRLTIRLTTEPPDDDPPVDLLALDQALEALGEVDPLMVRVVECRFFAGMTIAETAAALRISPRTVDRTWTRARIHLYGALAHEADAANGSDDADGPDEDATSTR